MDKQQKLIFFLVLIIIIVIALIVFFVIKPFENTNENSLRDNKLRLAQEYYEQGEFQRALDIIDELLISNPDDQEARKLRDDIIKGKKDEEAILKDEAQKKQDEFSKTVSDLSKTIEDTASKAPVPKYDPKTVKTNNKSCSYLYSDFLNFTNTMN